MAALCGPPPSRPPSSTPCAHGATASAGRPPTCSAATPARTSAELLLAHPAVPAAAHPAAGDRAVQPRRPPRRRGRPRGGRRRPRRPGRRDRRPRRLPRPRSSASTASWPSLDEDDERADEHAQRVQEMAEATNADVVEAAARVQLLESELVDRASQDERRLQRIAAAEQLRSQITAVTDALNHSNEEYHSRPRRRPSARSSRRERSRRAGQRRPPPRPASGCAASPTHSPRRCAPAPPTTRSSSCPTSARRSAAEVERAEAALDEANDELDEVDADIEPHAGRARRPPRGRAHRGHRSRRPRRRRGRPGRHRRPPRSSSTTRSPSRTTSATTSSTGWGRLGHPPGRPPHRRSRHAGLGDRPACRCRHRDPSSHAEPGLLGPPGLRQWRRIRARSADRQGHFLVPQRIPIRLKLTGRAGHPDRRPADRRRARGGPERQQADEVRDQTSLATAAIGPAGLINNVLNERNYGAADLLGATARARPVAPRPARSPRSTRPPPPTDESLASLRDDVESRGGDVADAYLPVLDKLEEGIGAAARAGQRLRGTSRARLLDLRPSPCRTCPTRSSGGYSDADHRAVRDQHPGRPHGRRPDAAPGRRAQRHGRPARSTPCRR